METYVTEEELEEAKNMVTFIKLLTLDEQPKVLSYLHGFKDGAVSAKLKEIK